MLARNTILQNRYRIVRPLGRGGMGQVYEAIDDTVDSIVVIKETFANSDKLRDAFLREAKLLANLKHPVLPRVMHYFLEGDAQFLVMEFIEGLDLAERLKLRSQPFDFETVLLWSDRLLDALAYLHDQPEPVIHRDIKPANIKVTNSGDVYLLDFGLAKGAPGQTSSVHGYTVVYAPLEQLNNAGTTAQSDLYSLGATLYHLLTGQFPSSASERYESLEENDFDLLKSAHDANPNVPEELSSIISQAMGIKRKDRFRSAEEMRESLRSASLKIKYEREQKTLDTPTERMANSEERRKRAEEEAHRRVEAEANRRADEERLAKETEARRQAEEEARKEHEEHAISKAAIQPQSTIPAPPPTPFSFERNADVAGEPKAISRKFPSINRVLLPGAAVLALLLAGTLLFLLFKYWAPTSGESVMTNINTATANTPQKAPNSASPQPSPTIIPAPTPIEPKLTKPSADFIRFARASPTYLGNENVDVMEVDLNGDGIAELLAQYEAGGSGGAPTHILQRNGTTFNDIGGDVSDSIGFSDLKTAWVQIGPKTTGGYFDITLGGQYFKFDGRKYKCSKGC